MEEHAADASRTVAEVIKSLETVAQSRDDTETLHRHMCVTNHHPLVSSQT